MAFSDTQTQAIAHKDGPALVLAGPGSGKTTVITNRIVTLLERYHIPGSRILVITFTRAAAQEMQSRFFTLYQKRNARLDAARSTGVTFGTFHSVFYRILKHAYQYDASNILTQKEQYKMIESITMQKAALKMCFAVFTAFMKKSFVRLTKSILMIF